MRKIIRTVAIIILLLVFCLSAYKFTSYFAQRHVDSAAFEQLQQIARTQDPTRAPAEIPDIRKTEPPAATTHPTQAAISTGVIASPAPTVTPATATPAPSPTGRTILENYAPLYEMNPDFFGWLRIEDTVIDYPVMHTPENPQYYLHRNFEGEYSYGGVLFMEESCYPGCGNYLIHGHHMRDGSMFGRLDDYADAEFGRAHPIIRFDTLDRRGEYELVAVFYGAVYRDDAPGFRYYEYIDLTDPADFDEYMAQVRALALYDTGVNARFGDEIITLSTCEYHRDDGRFVVVARKPARPTSCRKQYPSIRFGVDEKYASLTYA